MHLRTLIMRLLVLATTLGLATPSARAFDPFDDWVDDPFDYCDDFFFGPVVPTVGLNWGSLAGPGLPYERFAFGGDAGVGYRVPCSPAFVGVSGGYHGLKSDQGSWNGSYASAGPMIGIRTWSMFTTFVNIHWGGIYDFDDSRRAGGIEISATLGWPILYLAQGHIGVFLPLTGTTEGAAVIARLGVGF